MERYDPYTDKFINDVSDTISRRAAIDVICSICGNDCDKSEFIYNAPQDEQVIMCPEHYALSTLPPTQPEQRWIPVTERLPEERYYNDSDYVEPSDSVLVFTRYKTYYISRYWGA